MTLRAPVIASVILAFLHPRIVSAQEDHANLREAAKHFQRGVTLYGETDYRGAVVEFNRAYALAPSRAVLYNIGETNYQLRDYANALAIFERYLAETLPNDAHRAEIEDNVKELRSRVGQLTVMTDPSGAEIAVDDRVVGKTPFERPVIVSIGRLKVSASIPGRPPVTRYVDVAAEDNVSVTLEVAAPPAAPPKLEARAPAFAEQAPSPYVSYAAPPSQGRIPWRKVGWIATGVFAAGAVGFGIAAIKESDDLKDARAVYPTTTGPLDHRASLTTTFSVLADSFSAAAIIAGGLTLYSSLSSGSEAPSASVRVGTTSLDFRMTF